jgi:hypothetical protein
VTSQLISATYLFIDTPLSSILGSPQGRATTMYGAFFCVEKKLIKQKQVYNQWLCDPHMCSTLNPSYLGQFMASCICISAYLNKFAISFPE